MRVLLIRFHRTSRPSPRPSADGKMAKELPASSWRLPRGKINFHNSVSMQTILDSWKMMPIVSAKKKKKYAWF